MRAVLAVGALAPLALLAVLLPLLGGGSANPTRPKYIVCGESSECGTWECCVLGTGRFSLPRCQPLAELGAFCRPGREDPENVTLSYPDGRDVFLPAVHLRACPCSPGLHCDPLQATCAAAGDVEQDLNDLDDVNAL